MLEEISTCVGVLVDHEQISRFCSPFCMEIAEPTLFCAKTLLRSRAMESVLGVALSKQLRYSLHRRDFDLEVVLEMRGLPMSELVLQEFIAAKREISMLKGARHHIGDDRDAATLTMDDDGSGIAT